MIKVNEIAFVGYPVTDKQRAIDFYEGLLGLKQSSGHDFPDGFWLEYEIGPDTLALSNFWKPSAGPSMGPSIAFEVENFDETIAMLKAKSIPFFMEPLETPVCFMAVVGDPDGNSLFIHKRKPEPRLTIPTSPPPTSL
jgi:catechol 2,3-dioxygenase-like lactoylglutathione lyase family enzyme